MTMMTSHHTLHDSIKPAGLIHPSSAKCFRIQFGWWAVRASVGSPNGPRVSAANPRTAAHPAGFRQIWRRGGETKPVA